jgi:outer membrane biosynthesis protein TonB
MKKKIVLNSFVITFVMSFLGFNICAQTSAGGAIMAIDERTLAGGGSAEVSSPVAVGAAQTKQSSKRNSSVKKQSASKSVQAVQANAAENTYKKPTPKLAPSKKYDGFVIGDKNTFYNFEIVKYVQPVHTIKAQEAGAKGLVQVEILIGENGNVLQAKARSGNKILHAEAEKAALMTKFNKPSIYGKPARAFGFIVFRFGPPED